MGRRCAARPMDIVLKLTILILVYVFILHPIFLRGFHVLSPSIPEHILKLVDPKTARKMLKDDLQVYRITAEKVGKIPKIFHQIYANDQIPDVYVPLIRSWMKHHPEWEYWLWDDISGRQLVQKFYPKFLPLYDSYCHDLFRSDALRYFVLHHFGGVYVDMDYEALKNISPLLVGKQCILVNENQPQSMVLYNKPDMVMNAWMASVKHHPYWKFVINMLPSHAACSMDKVLVSTGPLLIYKLREEYNNITKCTPTDSCYIHTLPSRLMMPQWAAKGLPDIRRHCTPIALLRASEMAKNACKIFRKFGFRRLPVLQDTAYATHKFLHLGNYGKNYKAERYNISEIVPSVINPSLEKI